MHIGFRMAFTALPGQIGFYNSCITAHIRMYVMGAMTIGADCHSSARFQFIRLLLVKIKSDPVKIGKIGLQYFGGKPVLAYDILIGVAIPAHFRNMFAVCQRKRVAYIVRLMTIHTDRYILIIFVYKRLAMDACSISAEYHLMAFFTPLCTPQFFGTPFLYGMTAMTVYADRRIEISLIELGKVNTFQSFRVFIEMAAPAGL